MGGAQDLLKEQTKSQEVGKTATRSNPEPSGVLKAKEAAEIAESELKRVAAEHKRKLLEKGYQTLEEALVDVEKRKQESNRILDLAQQQQDTIAKKLEEIETEKQKITNLEQIITQKEAMIKSRLEKAIEKEQEAESKNDAQVALKTELQKMIEYHKIHIKPCRQALLNTATSVYNWMDELSKAKVDFSDLYNYIGKQLDVLDSYQESTNLKLPEDKDLSRR